MLKRMVSAMILTLLLASILKLAFNIQPVKTELIERRAGVNVEDWIEYKNYSFSWKPNVPYDELKSDFKSFIKNHVDLYSFKVVVLEISDTLVKYQSLLRFKNGTEQVIQTFVNIETGTGSNMWLIGANLSDGDSIYTHYPDWIITETIQSVYLGDSREVNLLLGKTTNYTSGPYTVGSSFTIVWDRLTGILLEWYGLLEATEDNQTVTYSFNLEITGTNKWGYKIWIVDDDGSADFSMIQEAINAANPGDTIFVRNGTYYENVVVNKTVSVIGENIGTTIIDGNRTGNVVLVEGEDDVTMTGVTVRNGTNGFYIVGLNHTVIRNIILNNTYHGIDIVGRNNQISENTIANNRYAIVLDASSYNIISRNTIMSNQGGINLCEDCEYNEISKNTLMNNTMGIGILGNNNSVVENTIKENWSGIQIAGTNNTIYHNNFINNTNQVYLEYSLPNSWDNSYPSGGNYWSDYTGVDSDHDGIGDSRYEIDGNNIDHYPLMGMFSDFNATSEYHVQTVCNSSISDLVFNGTAINFNVSGENGTTGSCRICIPTALINDTYRVFVNGTEILPAPEPLPCSNHTHNYLYFTYNHSTQEIVIVPEFPSFIILPLFMIATLLAVIVYKRKHQTRDKKREV